MVEVFMQHEYQQASASSATWLLRSFLYKSIFSKEKGYMEAVIVVWFAIEESGWQE